LLGIAKRRGHRVSQDSNAHKLWIASCVEFEESLKSLPPQLNNGKLLRCKYHSQVCLVAASMFDSLTAVRDRERESKFLHFSFLLTLHFKPQIANWTKAVAALNSCDTDENWAFYLEAKAVAKMLYKRRQKLAMRVIQVVESITHANQYSVISEAIFASGVDFVPFDVELPKCKVRRSVCV
jgi:hypothetical protein